MVSDSVFQISINILPAAHRHLNIIVFVVGQPNHVVQLDTCLCKLPEYSRAACLAGMHHLRFLSMLSCIAKTWPLLSDITFPTNTPCVIEMYLSSCMLAVYSTGTFILLRQHFLTIICIHYDFSCTAESECIVVHVMYSLTSLFSCYQK